MTLWKLREMRTLKCSLCHDLKDGILWRCCLVTNLNIDKLPFSDKIKSKLNFLVNLLLNSELDPQMVILFGSYARCEYKATSDLDILVLTKNQTPQELRGELCADFEVHNTDLIFYKLEDFQASNRLIVSKIRKEGILLWQK